jgi:hypothetical protein
MSEVDDFLAPASIRWAMLNWFARQGVPRRTLIRMIGLHAVRGKRGADGWLDPDPNGREFLAFREEVADDVVFWCPRTNEFSSLCGRAFALGEDNIADPTTYQFDAHLHVHADALSWLRDEGRGIVVIDWSRAFDRLRDVPRIAVAERLLPQYREAMKPQRLPELSVIASPMRLAA